MPGLHHVELWITDLDTVRTEWRWILQHVGFALESEWPGGESWAAGGTYLTLTTSPNLSAVEHDRRRPGLNHLAFHGGDRAAVDAIIAEAPGHGWQSLYTERYPHAGGDQHYAGWLENSSGFKLEIVADSTPAPAQAQAPAAPYAP